MATYYVATTGSDGNPGTQASPKRNISSGLALITPGGGDILDIRAGTYSENLDENSQSLPSGTAWSNAATIRAHVGEVVTLNGTINITRARYVIFQDMFVIGSGNQAISCSSDGIGGTANHIRFVNVDAKNTSQGNVVQVTQYSSFNEFIGGNYHDAQAEVYAFYIVGKDNTFDGVLVHDNGSYGIHMYSGHGAGLLPDRNVVRNCRIYRNGLYTPPNTSGALLLGSGDSNVAYNNLIYDNFRDGVQISNGATNSKLYNNTITRNNSAGTSYGGVLVGSSSGGSLTTIKNNIIYDNDVADVVHLGTPCTMSNNLSTNPLFVNP